MYICTGTHLRCEHPPCTQCQTCRKAFQADACRSPQLILQPRRTKQLLPHCTQPGFCWREKPKLTASAASAPWRSLSSGSIQTLPKMLPFIFPPPRAGRKQAGARLGCSSARRRAGICRQPGGLASCLGQTAFPSRRRTGGSRPPGPGLGHGHALGKGLGPGPAFWAPSELLLRRRLLPTSAAAMPISVAGIFIACLQTSHFPALEYIMVVVLTENRGVPIQERLAAYAGRCRELGQAEKLVQSVAGCNGGSPHLQFYCDVFGSLFPSFLKDTLPCV